MNYPDWMVALRIKMGGGGRGCGQGAGRSGSRYVVKCKGKVVQDFKGGERQDVE